MIKVKIKKLNDTATIPSRGSDEAAGIDIHANNEIPIVIKPHETVKISTGFATEMEKGTVGLIYARSGLAANKGLRPCQGVGVIDSDYRGEWFIPLHNDSKEDSVIERYEKIAQVIFIEYPVVDFIEVEELSNTIRGDGGFGSTGK